MTTHTVKLSNVEFLNSKFKMNKESVFTLDTSSRPCSILMNKKFFL